MKTIRYCIDNILAKNDKSELVVEGWAYAESKLTLRIEVIGESNSKIERFERPDIFHQFKEQPEALKSGFKIVIPYKNKIKIKFSTKEEEIICSFKGNDRSKIQKSSKIGKILGILKIGNILKIFKYISYYGIQDTFKKIKNILFKSSIKNITYEDWLHVHKPNMKLIDKQRNKKFKHSPKISLIVRSCDDERFTQKMIISVLKQSYSNWELCISDKKDLGKLNEKMLPKIKRIDVKDAKGAEALNILLNNATGEYIALINEEDFLEISCLYEFVDKINKNVEAEIFYSDEDTIDIYGKKYFNPNFKQDWAIDTFRSCNYLSHLVLFSANLLDKVGKLNPNLNGDEEYDLLFRLIENANNIVHISKILYHSREKNNDFKDGKAAIQSHLDRVGFNATVRNGLIKGTYKVDYGIDKKPLVSILIPNKDEKDTLKTCIDSIIDKSTYKNIEIIIIENNSTTPEIFNYYKELDAKENIKVVTWREGFNYSAINNFGFQEAKGEYIILLNNDIEVITPSWIEEMLMYTQRKEVGITGAKLYYPDNNIQHAGVILGIGGVAGHSHGGFKREDDGYQGRLKIVQNLSAVTAACLMIRKEVFKEVGGLDEQFAVAFNDIDFCMKVRKKGYSIIFNPFVELYHYESKSRGEDTTPEKAARFKREIERFHQKWGLWVRDPYYNDNLTLDEENFSLKV